MVIIQMMAGLANRMFHYSIYKELISNDVDAYIDDAYIPKLQHEKVDIKSIFPNIEYKRATTDMIRELGGGHDYISRLKRKIPILRKQSYYHFHSREGFNENIFHISDNRYISGSFQSELYFKNIENYIRADFSFKELESSRNIDIVNQMKCTNSIAIHIRKGPDYDNVYNDLYSTGYYEKAISYILNIVSDPQFYVFTDNPEWVKRNFTKTKYTLIDWNPTSGTGNHLDMQLMSCAKHNIIANSTYSWWGAWLNNNTNKVVIAPQCWYHKAFIPKTSTELSITPDSWVTL